jgi:hypothetical protein
MWIITYYVGNIEMRLHMMKINNAKDSNSSIEIYWIKQREISIWRHENMQTNIK